MRENVKSAQAALTQARAGYEQTMLLSLEEVETALVRHAESQKTLAAFREDNQSGAQVNQTGRAAPERFFLTGGRGKRMLRQETALNRILRVRHCRFALLCCFLSLSL